MRRWLLSVSALVALALPLQAGAVTLPISSPAPLGLDQGSGCQVGCITLDAPAPGTGNLTITGVLANNSFVSADVSIFVPFSSFGGGAQTFVAQTYSATGASLLVLDDGLGGWLLVGMGFAPGSVSPADASVQLSAINCAVSQATLSGQCGFTWGGASDFTANGYSWIHTFNVVVPEPGTLLSLGMGVAGLALFGQRHRQIG